MKVNKTISLLLACAAAGISAMARGESTEAFKLDKPLVAHWTFDEELGGTCLDASGNGCDATNDQPPGGLDRAPGVFGNAVNLTERHRLRVRPTLSFASLSKISFSAWVQPATLEHYNEIFRKEDGEQRLLFSFQENGRVLSLGLNIGGYVECDASLDPTSLLDGGWHHVAATFDGKTMRVYLDGAQIGSLERPGVITAGGPARGFIGSSNGGECFQGAIDDLRIYADAFSTEEVARIYQNGLEAMARSSPPAQVALEEFFTPGQTFAETLAATRRNFVEKGVRLEPKLARAFLGRLRSQFLQDCENFRTWTGVDPAAYLRTQGNELNLQATGRLIELLLEYKPLTEAQWAKQTPEDRQNWTEADRIKQRYDNLVARGDAAQFSPEWIEVMFEAGQRIVWRPREQEPVAPYVPPATLPPREFTASEARAALEGDWLHQADGKPTAARIRSEIGWARQLARRLAAHGGKQVDLAQELAVLQELENQATALAESDRELYFKVRLVKRAILFKNPVLDFERILFVDMPFPQGSEWPHETRHRLGYMAVPGGCLLVLDGLRPDGRLTRLMPQPPLHGSFWRPDLSFDATRILFCFKPHNEKSFHLYEINVDGTGLVQLTDGPFDDLDPIYLPDGHILFTTTRGHSYVRCMPPTNAYVLARCDRDGRNIYLISANNEPDYLPSVLNDGRIIYTRWEYTDKPLWRGMKLWTINPDGTQVQMFWGNQSVWPDLTKDARSIPDTRRVMFTGSAHHNWFAGSVGIIDPDNGFNFPHGITKITADVPWPETGNGPLDPVESLSYHTSGRYAAYYSPYPLSEQDFLVSANREGKFVLYLMDTDGNRELIYEGVHHVFHAMPLRPRPRPPVIANRVTWPTKDLGGEPREGIIFSSDIYQGAPPELRDKAKFLRVIHIDPKTYTYWHKRPYISTGPVVSAVQSDGVKRVLGTVPVEADGSVAFSAPSGMALHFQLLDENQRALQTMRSFVNVMPGEYRGCLGCHESHSRSPVVRADAVALAKPPRRITPPPWGEDTVSYPRYVRPVLDRYCAKCHEGEGDARKVLDLTERPSSPIFTEPYLTLIGRPTWGRPYVPPDQCPPGFGIAGMLMVEGYSTTDPQAYLTPKPMAALSYTSRLIDLCSSGKHYDVRVDDVSLQRLIVWVDSMCPFKGDEEVRAEADPVFQGVEWLAIRPRVATAPRIARPGPVD